MPQDQENQFLAKLGRSLRQAREARGLNLHELARLSGVSAPALSLIETGKRDPRLTTLNRIAAALRIALSDLVEEQRKTSAKTPSPGNEGYDLGDYR